MPKELACSDSELAPHLQKGALHKKGLKSNLLALISTYCSSNRASGSDDAFATKETPAHLALQPILRILFTATPESFSIGAAQYLLYVVIYCFCIQCCDKAALIELLSIVPAQCKQWRNFSLKNDCRKLTHMNPKCCCVIKTYFGFNKRKREGSKS